VSFHGAEANDFLHFIFLSNRHTQTEFSFLEAKYVLRMLSNFYDFFEPVFVFVVVARVRVLGSLPFSQSKSTFFVSKLLEYMFQAVRLVRMTKQLIFKG